MIKTIITGVLAVGGLYLVYLILQLVFWTLIAIQQYIPHVAGACLIGFMWRKWLIYKKSRNGVNSY